MGRVQRTVVIALIPVIAAAVLNTGYQYLLAWDMAGDDALSGWRDNLLLGLGLDHRNPSIWGMTTAGLVHVVPVLIVAVVAGGLCERAFATQRNRPLEKGFLVSAIVFTLLLPPAVSLLHVALGIMFGIVFGKAVFGGEGKTFVNPALLGAAFVQVSFPTAHSDHPLWSEIAGYGGGRILSLYHEKGDAAFASVRIDWLDAFIGVQQGMMGTTSVLAVVIGGALLVWSGIASWRLIAGHVLGLVLIVAVCNALGGGILSLSWYWHVVLGSFAFGVVFVATDPASSASTNTARWIQGLIAGALVVFIRVVNPSHPDGVVIALLFGSMLAPLIDHAAIWFNIRQRASRHG